MELGVSDYKLVYMILNRKVMKLMIIFIKVRCFKSFNEKVFNKDLECVFFNVVYIFDDGDDICRVWDKMYINVLNSYVFIKFKRCRNVVDKLKFIIFDIKKVMWKRNVFKCKFNKIRLVDDWEVYRC